MLTSCSGAVRAAGSFGSGLACHFHGQHAVQIGISRSRDGGTTARALDHVEQLFYILCMVRIGVRELNQRTSQVIERVRRGETVIVTDHGEPVARLVPIGDTASFLDELIGAGKAIPPRFKGPLPSAVAFGDPSSDSTEVVSELRDEL